MYVISSLHTYRICAFVHFVCTNASNQCCVLDFMLLLLSGTYAEDFKSLVLQGIGRDFSGSLVRRRLWQRRLVFEPIAGGEYANLNA